jgi:hypothetical protein
MALVYAASWIGLDRDFTARTLTATLYIGMASALAGAMALLAVRVLAQKPWSARFAASLILLIGATAAGASLFIGIEVAWATHPMRELPLRIVMTILLIIGASALYGFLALAGPLLLPLGLPLVAIVAWLMARPPR